MNHKIKLGALVFIISCISIISACSNMGNSKAPTPAEQEQQLEQAKLFFKQKEYDSALKIIQPLAILNNAEAQYTLGYMYYYGMGVTLDRTIGYQWIEKAAQQHHGNAEVAMGILNDKYAERDQQPAKHVATTANNQQITKEASPTTAHAKDNAKKQHHTSNTHHKHKQQHASNNVKQKHSTTAAAPANKQDLATKKIIRQQIAAAKPNMSTYGPTSSKDTLWSISKLVRPNKSVSLHQMMAAILQANPNAFSKHNVNALKPNVILKIPDLEQIAKISHQTAHKDLLSQDQEWKNK